VARLPGHITYVWPLVFSPDGTTLASGSGDFTVRLWDTAPLKTRNEARRAAAALRPEAERLREQLWRQKKDAAAVVEALRADGAPTEPLRHAACVPCCERHGRRRLHRASQTIGPDASPWLTSPARWQNRMRDADLARAVEHGANSGFLFKVVND
jgi:hypothetical protein